MWFDYVMLILVALAFILGCILLWLGHGDKRMRGSHSSQFDRDWRERRKL